MEKIKNVKEFVEKLDNAKKVNPKDLSSDQDLTIGIMNLISIEEHLMFSGAKTGKKEFYDLINDVREQRKQMMQKIIPSYEGEVWCISKHLLAASMRIMEVGTKALSAGNTKDAYDLFNKSYELYSLFWGLNMDLIDLTGVKKVASDVYNKATMENFECPISSGKKVKKSENSLKTKEEDLKESKSAVRRLGDWVKNAVNCCIE